MKKNFSNFSQEDANRLTNSHAGKELFTMLQKDKAAMQSAAEGDLTKLQSQLSDFMEDPRAKALLRQLWEDYYG